MSFFLIVASILALGGFIIYGAFFKKTKSHDDGIPPDDRYPLW